MPDMGSVSVLQRDLAPSCSDSSMLSGGVMEKSRHQIMSQKTVRSYVVVVQGELNDRRREGVKR